MNQLQLILLFNYLIFLLFFLLLVF